LKKALEILKKHSGKRLGIGVSGGADSMCLLSLVLQISNDTTASVNSKNNPPRLKNDAANHKKENIGSNGFFKSITVLHVDHNLRPTSKRDHNLVQDYCAKYGITFKSISADIGALAKKNKQSIETAARHVRHEFYCNFMQSDGGDSDNTAIVLGHNLDDQAETVLMHIFRGCGLNGLIGMSETDGHIIRPLISTSKTEILQYVKQNKIPYAEDETNSDTKYSRNLIRGFLEAVKPHYPAATANINNLSRISGQTQNIILKLLKEEYYSTDNGAVLLDKQALKDSLFPHYIIRAYYKTGLVSGLENIHIDAVKALKTGGKLDLPQGLTVYSERKHFVFCKNQYNKKLSSIKMPLFKKGLNTINGFSFFAEECFAPFKINADCLLIDADLIDGAVVRFRQDGDTFKPYGNGTKKLKSFLNEKHIPNRKKDTIPLIAKNSEVLVVVGTELSDKVKITDTTKRAYRIKL